jgi:hypothetical protein
MKKTIFLFLFLLLASTLLLGCGGKKEEVVEEPIVFEENDFKENMLESYNTQTSLEFEGRYLIGFMYSEGFSTDEVGTFINGNLQLTGRALDPSDIGDEMFVDGRTYSKNTTSTGNLDLVLSSGNSIGGFYQKYFIPLDYNWNFYNYEEVNSETGRVMIDETVVRNEVINGRNAFIHEYTYIEFEGNKNDGIILKGSINRVTIRSYINISSYMNEMLSYDFGNKFMFADQINQTLGDNFTEGILSIEEFKVVFE